MTGAGWLLILLVATLLTLGLTAGKRRPTRAGESGIATSRGQGHRSLTRVSRGVPKVILVHGTFAGSPDDEGTKWWQRNSSFWKSLQQDLGDEAELVADRKLFRWTRDENTASARHEAAQELLGYLATYENSGTPYHLVGHSHGGTVIWQALKLSFRGRSSLAIRLLSGESAPLKNLLSWTTIGTPFIHRRIKGVRWAAAGVTTALVLFTFGTSMILALTLALLEAWLYSMVVFTCGWLTYFLFAGVVTSYDDGRALRRENMLNGPVFNSYGKAWFGVWSREDEAINSLRLVVDMQLKLIKERPLQRSPFVGWLWWIMLLPAKSIVRVVTAVVRPLLDSWVSQLIRRKALGDDRPAPERLEVSCAPFDMDFEDLCLDETLSQRVRARADEALYDNASELRSLLTAGAQNPGASLEEIADGWSLQEPGLIHTSYFKEEGVRKLVAAHIGLGQGSEQILEGIAPEHVEMVETFKGTVERVREEREDLRPRRLGVMARAILRIPPWVMIVVGGAVALGLSYIAAEVLSDILMTAIENLR